MVRSGRIEAEDESVFPKPRLILSIIFEAASASALCWAAA